MSVSTGSILAVLLVLALPGAAAAASEPALRGGAGEGFRAGAVALEITPPNAASKPGDTGTPVFLAGFGQNRRAEGVHDPLYARAVVLRHGETAAAIVVLDLVGLPYDRVQAIRRRIKAVPGDRVIIATTHVHSGPDTIGLWGPSPLASGVDEAYMGFMMDRVAAAVEAAAKAARPAKVRLGAGRVPDGLAKNVREPAIQDKTVTAVQIVGEDEKTIATLVNYACHPEVLMEENRRITADFCGPALRRIEARLGGVGIYLNGALGGMVTPDVPERTFAQVSRVGEGIADAALRALADRPAAPVRRLAIRSRVVEIPLENEKFRLAVQAGLIRATVRDGLLATEVCRLDLGEAVFVTVPGELLPRPGLQLRERIPARYGLIVGLGNDELGYILHPDDFDRHLYRYERSMSVGRQAWPKIEAALKELLAPGEHASSLGD